MVGELVDARERLDQTVVELERMRSREADALNARNARHVMDERREIDPRSVGHRAGKGVDVLSEKGHLNHALRGERAHLLEHRVEGPADLLATCIGHDAEAAVLAAALHHGHVGACAFRPRRRQPIELLDLGKAHVDHRAAALAALGEHVCKPMKSLRAEHEVDERGALGYRVALLARYTAADTDQHPRPLSLERAPLTEQREHLLLRLLANRARVHEQYVRLGGVVGWLKARSLAQHVRHPGGVVLVHLTAEGFDEVVAGHTGTGHGFYGLRTAAARQLGRVQINTAISSGCGRRRAHLRRLPWRVRLTRACRSAACERKLAAAIAIRLRGRIWRASAVHETMR